MDTFDNIYEEKSVEENSFDLENQRLLDEKRKEIYKFFGSILTAVIVIGLWVSFLLTIYGSISSFATEGGSAFSKVITLLLNIFMGIIVPMGFFKLYIGSKKKNFQQVDSGFIWLVTFFKIMKVILIISVVIFAFFSFLPILAVPLLIIPVIIAGGFFALALYIISIFKDFLEKLEASFRSANNTVPSAQRIKTYLIIILVLTIFVGIVFVLVLQNFESLIPAGYESDLDPILTNLDALRITIYIQFAINILSQAFLVYYVSQFDKTFTDFNAYYRKKIQVFHERHFATNNNQ
jgi:polyferredoxin